MDIYSLSETLTNKEWLGQPVYRKVINFGALPNNTTKNVAHGIAGIVFIMTLTGISYAVAAWGTIPSPANSTGGSSYLTLSADAVNVSIKTSFNFSATPAYIIMEYTKS